MNQLASHVEAVMFHLTEAADADSGSPTEHYHLSAASTRATLASVEVGNRQADAMCEAARINGRLLALMVQGEPEAAAAIAADAPAEGVAR